MYFKNRKIVKILILITSICFIGACNDNEAEKIIVPKSKPLPKEKWYAPITPAVSIPLDEAPHKVLLEWWYYTGRFFTEDGEGYRIILIVFQSIRGDMPALYISNFSIANDKEFKLSEDQEVISRDQVKFGGTDGFNLKVGSVQLSGKNGVDRLKARIKDGSYSVDLIFTDVKGIALPGNGLINYGKDVPWLSYYYERPRMAVRGTITVGGKIKNIKDGMVWFDHQWGNFIMNSKWIWFSAQLSDGSDIMFYPLHNYKNQMIHTYGIYIPPCKECGPNKFLPSVDLNEHDVTIAAKNSWKSPKSGVTYPIDWSMKIKPRESLPSYELKFHPVINNAEVIFSVEKTLSYWEGDNYISGTKNGKPVTGFGFIEMAGFNN